MLIISATDVYAKNHRYLKKEDCSSFVMCPLLVLPILRAFLQRPLTVLTKQTRQATDQSIFLRCLCKETHENNNKELVSCSFSLAIGRLVFVRQTGLFEMDQTLL